MSGQETVTDENFRTGAVVSRGPDWRWGNQDAHPPGRLLRKTNDGRCWVRWGNGSEFDYRIGSSDAHDLVYGRTPLTLPPVDAPMTTEQMATLKALEGTDVTADTFLRGAIVSRGRDWRWADQDKDGPGRLLRLCKDGVRCWVAWGEPSAHKERDYRIGSNDCFDLVFGAEPAEPRKRVPEGPVPADGTPVTTENYVRFATVSRGPGWRWGDQDKSGPGTMMRTNKNKTHCWVQWPDGTERDYRIELGDLVYGTTPAAPLDLKALAAAAKFPVGARVTSDNVVIGGRVSRGRDWKWGDQDGGKPGYIIARTGDGLRCWVRWDISNEEAGKKDMDYRIGSSDAYDLVYGDTPSGDHDLAAAANEQMTQITALKGRDVTRANFIRGAIVSRGRDWKWGKQDAAGNGRLARMCSDGDRCWVRWGDDTERDYRIGSADAFDLVYGSTPARPDVELSDDVEDEEAAEEGETSTDDETNSSAEADEGKTCPVCVDPLSRGRYKKIRCDNGHIACHACLDSCIIQNFANARRSNAEAPVLRCFADEKCDCVLELVDIARVASREATETYLRVCQDYRDAQALADAYGALQSELRRLRAALRSGATDQLWRGQREDNTANGAAATGAGGMTTMLSNDFVLDAAVVADAPVDGTVTQAQRVTGPGVALEGRFLKLMFPASLMCPRCQLGPIDISGCDNLESHHLERIGPAGDDEGDDDAAAAGGDTKAEEADEHEHESGDDAADGTEKSPKRLSSRRVRIIRNECPGCKFFGATVSDWKVWDGVIRRMPTAAARSAAASATASL